MIERIVIGSTNVAKVNEWSQMLQGPIEVKKLTDLGEFPDVEETGTTFSENAAIKAKHYAKLTGEYVMSDDGGYEIDYLGGLPGVKSRRILPGDKEGTDDQLIDFVLEKLKGVPLEKRTVKLTSVAAISDPEGNIIFKESASSKGIVTEDRGPILIKGYPFRTIHWLPELNKTYAELTDEEHEKYSHKWPVAKKIIEFLKNYKG